jgi:hypothetical protein
MERRNLLVGLTVVIVGIFAMSGSALAHKAPKPGSTVLRWWLRPVVNFK